MLLDHYSYFTDINGNVHKALISEINSSFRTTGITCEDGFVINSNNTKELIFNKGCDVTYIGMGNYRFSPFGYSESIEYIKTSNSLTSIGTLAFADLNYENGCEIDLSESTKLTEIPAQCFYCDAGGPATPKKVVLPSSIITIKSQAFYNCKDLIYVNLPQSLQTIETSVFGQCRNLTSLDIYPSVQHIGADAFSGCNLEKIHVKAGDENRVRSLYEWSNSIEFISDL